MRKKILIAEQSDTTRGVAENVLRQHGYEVISVSTGDKALEVLELSRPNLMVIDCTMTFKGKHLLLEKLQEDPLTSSIPIVIIADENVESISYPEEIVLTRPLDPKDLILKISTLGSSEGSLNDPEGSNLLEEESLEEDLLDAALGLDNIDVTDSEVMDNASIAKKKGSKGAEKMIGMEHDHDEEELPGSKVESHQLEDDESETGQGKRTRKELGKTGNLEILGEHEQFGLGNESVLEPSSEYGQHDYEWFIKEMKKENVPGRAKTQPTNPAEGETKAPKKSGGVDAAYSPPKKKTDLGKFKSEAGVEKFIEDFKKEVKKFTGTTPLTGTKASKAALKVQSSGAPGASGGIGNITIDQVEVFSRQFVSALAEKVAEKIATKIDSQKLLSLIKNEIVSKSQKQ